MEKALREQLPGGTFGVVPPARAHTMSAVKGRGNKTTEVRLRMALVAAGLSGWALHAEELPGCPDFCFPALKVVIFVDGCFWHGCPGCGHTPQKNRGYWETKIARNKARDKKATKQLRAGGYRVLRFWEHDVKCHLEACAQQISRELADRRWRGPG